MPLDEARELKLLALQPRDALDLLAQGRGQQLGQPTRGEPVGDVLRADLGRGSRQEAEFIQQRLELIALHAPHILQLSPHTVQSQYRLARLALERHPLHRGALCRFPDRARIGPVGLIGAHKGPHMLRGNQPHLVALPSEPPAPVVRAPPPASSTT
jgi:hypothetical protein